MTKNASATSNETLPAVVGGLKWTFFAALLGGTALPIAMLIWQAITPNVIIQRAGAGRFISASTTSSLLQPPLTTVTTTEGSLVVVGLFSAQSNQPLEVVGWNQARGIQLCAVQRYDTCLPLAGVWAGTLKPTAAASRAFNFQVHGLDHSTLMLWLFIGCALTLMVGVAWFGARAELQEQTRGTSDPPAIERTST